MTERKKFLCICNHGNVRSRCLAGHLTINGHHAIALGWATDGSEKIAEYSKWADVIVNMVEDGVLASQYDNKITTWEASLKAIPDSEKKKMVRFNVGVDVWGSAGHPILQSLVVNWVRKEILGESL